MPNTYDLAAFVTPLDKITTLSPLQGVRVSVAPFKDYKSGQYLTGVLKAVQKFLAFFLTARGSAVTRPEYGTDFMNLLRNGEIRTVAEVSQAFYLSVQQIRSAGIFDGQSFDEQITDVRLANVHIAAGTLTLDIDMTTADGRDLVVKAPISTK